MGLLGLKMLLRTTKIGFFMDHIHSDALWENHIGSIYYEGDKKYAEKCYKSLNF